MATACNIGSEVNHGAICHIGSKASNDSGAIYHIVSLLSTKNKISDHPILLWCLLTLIMTSYIVGVGGHRTGALNAERQEDDKEETHGLSFN